MFWGGPPDISLFVRLHEDARFLGTQGRRSRVTMRRGLTFATALGIALLACLAAVQAQQAGKVARVGFLYFGSRQPGPGTERYGAFLEGMRELGYIEGKDLIIEARFAESKPERLPELVEELLRLKVDVIVATGRRCIACCSERPLYLLSSSR